MGTTFYFDWEVTLMERIQDIVTEEAVAFANACSAFGETAIIILVLGFLYWCIDKNYGKYVGINVLVALVLGSVIKNIFLRRRPYFDHSTIDCLRPVESDADIYDIAAQGFSFPSMHSAVSVSLYGSLGRYKKIKWLEIIGIVLPLLVGISRFCLGVHYPTDVLAGWALGFAALFVIPFVEGKIQNKYISYGIYVLVGLFGWFFCTSEDYYTVYGILVGTLAAFLFEDKYVRFENTKQPLYCIVRLVCGSLLYLAIMSVFKAAFNIDIIQTNIYLSRLARFIRYALSSFFVIGIYPMIFKKFRRIYG